MVYSILVLIGTFSLGYILSNLVRKITSNIEVKNTIKEINNIYSKVLENVYSNKTFFKSRINNTVSLDVTIDEGDLTILYMIDKKDVAIFKGDKCIYTSDFVDNDILDELITTIDIYHKDKIVDVVNIMGLLFSREEFENKFNVKVDDFKNTSFTKEVSDIDKIIKDNDVKFDINFILDRISAVGIDNLTKEEREFLNNYNK